MSLLRDQENICFVLGENFDSIDQANKQLGGVYVALIDMRSTDDCYSVEVETDDGCLAFTYQVSPENSQALFRYTKSKLREKGIKVFDKFEDWDSAILQSRF